MVLIWPRAMGYVDVRGPTDADSRLITARKNRAKLLAVLESAMRRASSDSVASAGAAPPPGLVNCQPFLCAAFCHESSFAEDAETSDAGCGIEGGTSGGTCRSTRREPSVRRRAS